MISESLPSSLLSPFFNSMSVDGDIGGIDGDVDGDGDDDDSENRAHEKIEGTRVAIDRNETSTD